MVTAMYLTGCDDKHHSVTEDQGTPTMTAPYHVTEHFNQFYNNTAERLRTWHNEKLSSELLHVVPQKDFTNVTAANCERSVSRHGALNTNHSHYASDTERQRGDTVRSSACNAHSQWGTQYKHVLANSYYNSSKPTGTIDQILSSPAMLWDAETYPSWGYQSQPDWATYQVAEQDYDLQRDRAYSGPIDLFTPYLQEYPPTPADTIKGEEISRMSSLASNKSQGSSPLACKLESGSHAATSAVVTSAVTKRTDAADEQLECNILLTPLSERAAVSQDPTVQADSEQLLDKHECVSIKQDGDCYNSHPVPALEDGSDLNLSNDWDPSNLEFLDDANLFASGFMADQVDGWGCRQDQFPSVYPTLPLDSIFPSGTGTGTGLSRFPANAAFSSDISPNARFDQHSGYEPAQYPTFETTAFQDQPLDFNTHSFGSQPATMTTGNDRNSNRSKSKDQLLLDLKRQGYSYKDIKVMGNFEEAESTLRGRYRTLTKPKEARVRKPEWGDREIQLLFEAVDAHTNATHDHQFSSVRSVSTLSRRANRIPWKQVAEYMANRGAYKYGNATVKKKWSEVMEARRTSC